MNKIKGFMLAAPRSGAGKTLVTLALLRIMKEEGIPLAPFKAGPDYIDPSFHEIACATPSLNLDPWGMRSELVHHLLAHTQADNRMIVVEAMMGFYDAAADGTGSSASLAHTIGLPVILLIDCSQMSHSIAALVFGFQHFTKQKPIGGIILNKVASGRHETMLREALKPLDIPILGAIYRDSSLELPQRHLGLIQAGELTNIDNFIKAAAKRIRAQLDIQQLYDIAVCGDAPLLPLSSPTTTNRPPQLRPLGHHTAIACDKAFCFIYPHLLAGWREQGAILSFFSPLDDEAPSTQADSIYLPGGYPELHAAKLASNGTFKAGMLAAAAASKRIYGECGGYMVLGDILEDVQGVHHNMLGLLPLATSFKQRHLHLGYRNLEMVADFAWENKLRGHEFHYSSTKRQGTAAPLFHAYDACGKSLGHFGLVRGSVAGSFIHVIDQL